MKLKVAIFIESFQLGGAEKSLLSLLRNFDSKRYDIDLIVLRKGGEFEEQLPKWVNYFGLNYKSKFLNRLKFYFLKKKSPNIHNAQLFWKSFKDIMPKQPKNYDVAIAWGQGFATYYTSAKITANKKYAWVNTDYEKAGYDYKLDQKSYSSFNSIIGVSDYVRSKMKDLFPQIDCKFIPNLIDREEILLKAKEDKDFSFDNEVLNIVSVGRLVKPKAFDLSIKSAALLNQKGLKFNWYIIGEGHERKYLEVLIHEYKVDNVIKLIGFKNNPYPYIYATDIYVQTSLFEGLGRTLIEASYINKPIVTTNFPTASSIVEHNRTGIITKMNVESITQGIMTLVDNPELMKSFIQNSKNLSTKNKSFVLNEIYNLIES
ncbi:glycosyltransferase [Weeksellaceae bacterium KMM 9713]|uniref:Glycosyltransferase n=1 Tax=Profundicola chukchiensis TaxID=2961959 RepID=A0A9X4MWF5_9FLAO|nr:glycosyltransferase [Profundicola chukchiensis]MDG4944797.1 glycosyltransferase [Profundicola chukchiensis]